jgi:3-hydroxyisobutyryl-CoA hydrolase
MLSLEESLKKLDMTNNSAVCGIINQFSEKPPLKENSSLNR